MDGFAFRWGGPGSASTLIPPGPTRQLSLGHLSPDGVLLNIEGQAGDRAVWSDAYAQIVVTVAARNTPAVTASFAARIDHGGRNEEKLVGERLGVAPTAALPRRRRSGA